MEPPVVRRMLPLVGLILGSSRDLVSVATFEETIQTGRVRQEADDSGAEQRGIYFL